MAQDCDAMPPLSPEQSRLGASVRPLACLANLPAELHLLIADNLPTIRDIRNLSLANKHLHSRLDDICYNIAMQEGLAILAWAVQGDIECPGRATAAKKYLEREGGGAQQSRQPCTAGELPLLELKHPKMRRNPRLPGTRHLEIEGFALHINTEIVVVLAQLFSAEGVFTPSLTQRIGWIDMILQHAPIACLYEIGQIGWKLLFCWLCQHFDFSSDATLRIYHALKQGLPPIIFDNLHASHSSHEEGVKVRGENVLTHLIVGLVNGHDPEHRITKVFVQLVDEIISSNIAQVEESIFEAVILWQKSYAVAYPFGAASSVDDCLQLLLLLSRKCMKQTRVAASEELRYLGQKSLPFACQSKNLALIGKLLDLGVDVNTKFLDFDGKTPLMLARSNEMFEHLRLRGADLAARDHNGLSNLLALVISERRRSHARVLDWLDEEKYVSRMRLILGANRDSDLVNAPAEEGGPSPIYLAFNSGRFDRGTMWCLGVTLLVNHGADINKLFSWRNLNGTGAETSHQTRPLHAAILQRQSPTLARFLIRLGADPGREDEHGRTAYSLQNAQHYDLSPVKEDEALVTSAMQAADMALVPSNVGWPLYMGMS